MSTKKSLNKLYQETVGRNVDVGGFEYWSDQLASGQTTIAEIEKALVASEEYQDRAAVVKQYQDEGGFNPSEEALDALDSAYKGELVDSGPDQSVATVPSPNPPATKPTIHLKGPSSTPTVNDAEPVNISEYTKPSNTNSSAGSNYQHPTGQNLINELFEGYDSSAAGNFINKGDPGYDNESVKQTVAGILDIQGTAGNTQAQAAAILDEAPAGTDIKTLLQNLAGTSAAEIQEGTYQDQNYGHTYLMAVADPAYAAEHGIDVSGATVSDLYTKGLMRDPDQTGLDFWEEGKGAGDIKDIANAFLQTSESQTHQAFDQHFGRQAFTEGLDYFAGIDTSDYSDILSDEESEAAEQNKTISEYIGDIIGYRGGTFNPETGKDWDVSAETLVRDDLYNIAGEASTADQKNPDWYTAPKLSEVAEYRDQIRDAREIGEEEGAAAEAAVTAEITSKAHQLVGANRGDVDDVGEDPTMMGRFLSDLEQEQGHAEGLTADDWYDNTKGEVWGALATELDKTTLPIEQAGLGYKGEETLKKLAEERGEEFKINDYRMWNQKYLDEGGVKYDTDEWTLDPKKPDLPTDITINKEKVDYMPGFTSDVQLPSDVKYADRVKEFNTEYKSVPDTVKTAQGTAGQRFTGTSAKGVRMKRSKASRMGTIRGTKQLGREQQTKSLNI